MQSGVYTTVYIVFCANIFWASRLPQYFLQNVSQPHLTMKCLDLFPLEFVLVHCMRLNRNELKKLKLRLRFKRNTSRTEVQNESKKNVKLTDWGKGRILLTFTFSSCFVCFYFLFSLLLFCFFFLPPLKFVYFVHFQDVNECKGNASQTELCQRNCDSEGDWGKGKTDF